jgi:phospholipid N-methyltransferase
MMDGLKSLKNIGLFLKALWQQPRRMGAVVPSSPYLAAAMVKPIDVNAPGYVIEIGAGTGAITRALL